MNFSDFVTKLPFFKDIKAEQMRKVTDAEITAKEILIKAREEALKIEKEAEDAAKKATHETIDIEKRLNYKENELEAKKKRTESDRKRIESERLELSTKREEILSKLEKIAKLTKLEAKDLILKAWEEKLKSEIAHRIKQTEEQIKNTVDEKAREMFVDAIRYGAVDFTPEYTLSMVMLPNEEFKGRIIGKEGRNIRAFELATGVDVDLEEEGVIKFSSFDAIRREIARVSMERLIRDGRIQPSRIEEIVHKAKEETDKLIVKAGEDLCYKAGVHDLPQDLVQLLGRFKYRYSYGQNMILHTLEETKIGVALAHELKADVNVVRLGCLFHDIGKVVEGKEGSHVELGVEVLKKCGISEKAVHCVAASHEDIPFESVEAIIVHLADSISGARPGARHEDFEQYLKRIKDLEEIARAQAGVKEAYALQAGRELRVVVVPDQVSDDEATILAEKIKEDINKKFPVFPGQVTITVIREVRATATSHS